MRGRGGGTYISGRVFLRHAQLQRGNLLFLSLTSIIRYPFSVIDSLSHSLLRLPSPQTILTGIGEGTSEYIDLRERHLKGTKRSPLLSISRYLEQSHLIRIHNQIDSSECICLEKESSHVNIDHFFSCQNLKITDQTVKQEEMMLP